MNKPSIRIICGNRRFHYQTSVYYWIVIKKTENQSTVNNLINTLQLKYKIV